MCMLGEEEEEEEHEVVEELNGMEDVPLAWVELYLAKILFRVSRKVLLSKQARDRMDCNSRRFDINKCIELLLS